MANPSIPPAGQRLPSGTVTFLFTDIEGNEERITLGAHHTPIVRFARFSQNLLVLCKQGSEFFAQLLQESR